MEIVSLPKSLPEAVREEFGRAFHDPFEAPICIGINVVLIALGWWLLPAFITHWIFGYYGAHALPLTLLSWMVADVPATNVIGSDARRMAVALRDRSTLLDLLVAKAIVLWLLTAPLCFVVDLSVSAPSGNIVIACLTIVMILFLPFATLGMATWVGILVPYKPMPLRERQRQVRKDPMRFLRWCGAITAPYVVVPLLAKVCFFPVHKWGLPGDSHRVLGHPVAQFWGVMVGSIALALIVLIVGYRGALVLAAKRNQHLQEFLADEELG